MALNSFPVAIAQCKNFLMLLEYGHKNYLNVMHAYTFYEQMQ